MIHRLESVFLLTLCKIFNYSVSGRLLFKVRDVSHFVVKTGLRDSPFIRLILHFIVHTNSTVVNDAFLHSSKLIYCVSFLLGTISFSGFLLASPDWPCAKTGKCICGRKSYTKNLSSIPNSIILVFVCIFVLSLQSHISSLSSCIGPLIALKPLC